MGARPRVFFFPIVAGRPASPSARVAPHTTRIPSDDDDDDVARAEARDDSCSPVRGVYRWRGGWLDWMDGDR